MSDALDPRALADILRNPDDPRHQIAFDQLMALVDQVYRRNPNWNRVQAQGYTDAANIVQELTNDFWLRLMDHPGMLASVSIRGQGAIKREIQRFLREVPTKTLEVSQQALKEHLATKMRKVLRARPFQELDAVGGRGWWGLEGAVERTAEPSDIARARETLPALLAVWRPQRANQDPPVARSGDIAAHLETVIRETGAFCRFADLHDLTWSALAPPAAQAGFEIARQLEPGMDRGGSDDELKDCLLPIRLRDYLAGLDLQLQSIVRVWITGATVRDIEEATGIPKSTVETHLQRFRADLAERLRQLGYDEAGDAELIRVLRDIVPS